MSSPRPMVKKPISERISIFEKSVAVAATSPKTTPKVISTCKNISALKSQFNSGDGVSKAPPKVVIPPQKTTSSPPPPPPQETSTTTTTTTATPASPPVKGPPKSSLSNKTKSSSIPSKTSPRTSSPTKTRKTPGHTPIQPKPSTSPKASRKPSTPSSKKLSNASAKSPSKTPLHKTPSNASSSKTLKSKRPVSPLKSASPPAKIEEVLPSKIEEPPPHKVRVSPPLKIEESLPSKVEGSPSPKIEEISPFKAKEPLKTQESLRRTDSLFSRSDSLRIETSPSSLKKEASPPLSPVITGKDSPSNSFDKLESSTLSSALENEPVRAEVEKMSLPHLPTVKVTVEDVKLVKKDSFKRMCPPSTVINNQQKDDPLHNDEEGDNDFNEGNSLSISQISSEITDEKIGNFQRKSIEPPTIDSRIINSNYTKSQSPPPEKEVLDEGDLSLPTVKVAIEDIKLVKKDSFKRESPPVTIISDQEDDDHLEDDYDEKEEVVNGENSHSNGRKPSLTISLKEMEDVDDNIDDLLENGAETPTVDSHVTNGNYINNRSPSPGKDILDESHSSMPTVKVAVEDIKLVKKDSFKRAHPPTTVISDPEDDDYLDDEDEEVDSGINRLNMRNSSLSISRKKSEDADQKMGSFQRNNSIDSPINIINSNYIKNQSTLVLNAAVPSAPSHYWTNQALQNDNSQTINEALKLDLEFKEEKINALNKELEELHSGGATEEEIAQLKRQRQDLDARLKDQEEELDDFAGQVQMLEQSKTKLEMSLAAQKKEHRRELGLKEEELEDARAAAQKRVKALEQQLESEHEERMGFVREKHDLETKIMNLQELASRSTDEEHVIKLKKDLKRTKALLKDAQCMVEKTRADSSNKIVLRQLKNQLEDSEFAKMAAVKARQNTEMELSEVQQQLDDVMRSKNDLEDKLMRLCREKSDAMTQLEDNEEELSDVMKKYKAAVSQLSVDQITITQQSQQVADLEEERQRLKETLSELNQKIDNLESDNITSATNSRLELKIRELESKLELEQTTRGRMETQIGRLKEALEKLNHECDVVRNKEMDSQDLARKLQRQLRDSKEDYASLSQKEMEVNAKRLEYEKQLEISEAEIVTLKNDLKIALKRIEDLQTAIHGELSSETDSVSDGDSDSSDEGMDVFLEHHRRAVSVQRERESMSRELSVQREMRSSMAREMSLRPLETMSEHPEESSPLPPNNNNEVEKSPLKLEEESLMEGESQA